MYRVYGDLLSGNCYKIKLLMSYLSLPHEWVHVDILKGESRTPEFLAKNPNGKIPVLELEPGEYLFESNAILYYLADGTPYLPRAKLDRARVLQWQSFEQYSHEPYIAVARYIAKYLGLPAERQSEYESKRAGGYRALRVMEQRLASARFFVGERLSIADISLYAYTHVAHEGGFSLAEYPAVRRWIGEIERHPGHVAMPTG
ncbi:MAG TPA: glutathione S-transferase family protein [Gammaproteobacteria bacterium]|jgi:glutathione S-transferase